MVEACERAAHGCVRQAVQGALPRGDSDAASRYSSAARGLRRLAARTAAPRWRAPRPPPCKRRSCGPQCWSTCEEKEKEAASVSSLSAGRGDMSEHGQWAGHAVKLQGSTGSTGSSARRRQAGAARARLTCARAPWPAHTASKRPGRSGTAPGCSCGWGAGKGGRRVGVARLTVPLPAKGQRGNAPCCTRPCGAAAAPHPPMHPTHTVTRTPPTLRFSPQACCTWGRAWCWLTARSWSRCRPSCAAVAAKGGWEGWGKVWGAGLERTRGVFKLATEASSRSAAGCS